MSKNDSSFNRAMKPLNKNSGGFTIVELIVVIVVLAILAALIIVSYIGIKTRADTVTVQTDTSTNAKVLKGYQAVHATYPTSLDGTYCPATPVVDSNFCLKFSKGNGMAYYSGTANTFDLRISRGSSSPITYQITESTGPTSYVAATGPPSDAPIFLGWDTNGNWQFTANNTGAPITAVNWYIFVPSHCPNNFTTAVNPPVASGTIVVPINGATDPSCSAYLGEVTWHFWFSNSYGDGPEGTYVDYWE